MKNYVSLNGKGKFVIYANDQALQTVQFTQEDREALKFDEVNKKLRQMAFASGDNVKLKIALEDFKAESSSSKDFKVQYALSATYKHLKPPSTNTYLQFDVAQSTSGALGKGSEGKIFKYKSTLEYKNPEDGTGMAVVIIRVPSCLAMNFDLIEKMKDNNDFDQYEIKANNSELVLYWTGLSPGYKKSLSFEF